MFDHVDDIRACTSQKVRKGRGGLINTSRSCTQVGTHRFDGVQGMGPKSLKWMG